MMEERSRRKVLITGASGMIGSSILELCLQSDDIGEVISFARRSSDVNHQKLRTRVIEDFTDYSVYENELSEVNVVFFCMGVYTGQVSKEIFRKVTVDYPVQLAKRLQKISPNACFCLLSGSGADRTEKSNMMFARDKGAAENQIAELKLGAFYAFRPAYIYPVTPRQEPNMAYRLSRLFYPLLKLFGAKYSIPSTDLARAMFHAGMFGCDREIMENEMIVQFANNIQTPLDISS